MLGLVLLAALPGGTGCLKPTGATTTPSGRPLQSPKLNPFIYFEEGRALFIAVDGRAAQYTKSGTIFPLGLGLVNLGKTGLTFSAESFILETSDGAHYPVVSVEEYNREYKRSRTDRRLGDSFDEVMLTRFRNYNLIDWTLFPFAGQGAASQQLLELERGYWTRNHIYFPIPETGIHGQNFSLLVRAKESPETYVVRFFLR